MGGGSGGGGAPPGGLPAANAGAAAAPAGAPGGPAVGCGWEVYVTTHSEERFWTKKGFKHQLCALNSPLGAVQMSQGVTMTSKDSPTSKFTGSGSKRYGVTNTVADIATEKDWVIVDGPGSKDLLSDKNVGIRVANGQKGATAQKIDLYVRHPLLVYGHLRFKDPTDREVNFPKDFTVSAYSGTGAKADTEVATTRLDVDGKFNFEIDRKWDWFTFKFGGGRKKFISNGDAKTEKTELTSWRNRKDLEKADAKFFSPPAEWSLIESLWKFSEDPKYIDGTVSYKVNEGKIYLYDAPSQNWVRRIGEKAAPVKMLLDPKWQFIRYEYFDRYYGHSDHNHERVNMPSTVIEGYWAKDFHTAAFAGKLEREGSSHWTLDPTDAKKSVHCLPWIRQKDDTGTVIEKPDKDALIQFEFSENTFAASSDATTRKYEQIGRRSDRLHPSADRLKLYDMPVAWKSKNYWARYLTAPKTYDAKFWEDWDQAGYLKSRTKTTPVIFSLDDIVLTDADNVPLQTLAKTDQFALMYHRFKKEYDEAANLTEEGVYKPNGAEIYFSNIERKGLKYNYIVDYPNWIRMLAGVGACFDAFDQRTSKEVFGARAAVRWYDPVTSATAAGTALGGQPADIVTPYFTIGPEWGQQHAHTALPYSGSGTPAIRIGRFDMVLLRCCDRLANKGNKELFLNLQFFNLNFDFSGPPPAAYGTPSAGSGASAFGGNPKGFIQPCLTALMKRWNGDDVGNNDRAEIVPQKTGKDFTGEVLYFLQPFLADQGAHFRMYTFHSGSGSDRAFMASEGGVGQLIDNNGAGIDKSFGDNSFVAAHELGHGGSMPDEYGEWWSYCSHNGPGLTNNIPGEPFVDDGGGPDLANLAYLSNVPATGTNATFGMMSMAADMRNRYFWHNAEFARKHIKTPFFAKLGAYDQYKVPLNSKYPYRTYAYWPVRKKMNRKGRKHGAADIHLHVLGKDVFSQNTLTGAPRDGMVSIFIKIDLTIDNTLVPTTADIETFRDLIRNAILPFNYKYTATGSTGVKVDGSILREDWKFTNAAVRFSPRFIISNTDGDANYAANYTHWQTTLKPQFQVSVVDNTGKAAKTVAKSGFTAKKGGAIQLGYNTADPAAQASLQADVQALLPEMLGIKLAGATIAAKDLTPLAASVIHSGAKVT